VKVGDRVEYVGRTMFRGMRGTVKNIKAASQGFVLVALDEPAPNGKTELFWLEINLRIEGISEQIARLLGMSNV